MAMPNSGAPSLPANAASPEIIVNTNDNLLDYMMNSHIAINFSSDADLTLSASGSYPQQWQYGVIELTDTGVVLTTGRNVIVPVNERVYKVVNNTAQTLTVKTSAGTGIAVTAGKGALLYCDGTNVEDGLPGVGSGITAVVDDTTPQFGGQVDNNGFPIGDGTNEILGFGETGSAVNYVQITNSATGNAPLVSAVGDDTNINLNLDGKGTGGVQISGAFTLPTVDGTSGQVLTTDGAGAVTWDAAGATDADAIHDNVAGEIAALTLVTVASADHILIEDADDSNNKKRIAASDLLGAASLPVPDTTSIVEGSADSTKELRLEVDGLTTSTTRVWTVQDLDLTVAGTDVVQAYTASQSAAPVTLTSSSNSVAVDLSLRNNFELDMTENTTLAAPTNAAEGQSGVITITQDAATAYTLAYNTFWEFEGGSAPALSTTLSSRSTFVYYVDAGGATATCNLIGPVS